MEEHPEARSIVETLVKAGFVAYYAGGWVRDFLLRHVSDDIDIATDAPPEKIQELFPRTVPIGLSFGIVLVLIGERQYEVATFRQDLDYRDGRRPSRVTFCSAEEDAKRRDFTINGMFYNPLNGEILDYVGGKKDLEKGVIRAIGDPHQRIAEDRLRMIRAIRLACRFHFPIDGPTEAAIRAHAKELFPAVAIERVVQELEKGHAFRKLRPMLLSLHQHGLLAQIFPSLASISLTEIERRLQPLQHYPQRAPLIAHLLPLFGALPLTDQLALCQTLKLSNADQQFVAFLFHTHTFLSAPHSLSAWAHFYAHPLSSLTLSLAAAHSSDSNFLFSHTQRQQTLAPFIHRIQTHTPILTSQHLIAAGVPPGKTLGTLLRLAEQLSIDEQIEDPITLLHRLKQFPEWPKESSEDVSK